MLDQLPAEEELADEAAPIHSFIVKVLLDPIPGKSGRFKWRAQVAHVPSGRQRYVPTWDELIYFILDFLDAAGAEFNLGWRLRYWLNRRPGRR